MKDVLIPAPDFDLAAVRADFPVLSQLVHGKLLCYLDNAASAQTPRTVIERWMTYQSTMHANVHRGVHTLSQRATEAFEAARETVRGFINARHAHEIIWTRGATEAVNLVMHGYGRTFLQAGDEIVVSTLEHHANIVPWQMLCEERGCVLRVVPIHDTGVLDWDAYCALLGPKTRLVAMTHVSNALGTVVPIKAVIDAAHAVGALVLVDGAQAAPHLGVDVQALDCDFYVFSGHKLCGPTGIGVLYGKSDLLERMRPYQGGGDMIAQVTFDKTTYNRLPYKFEAGTPAIANAIALASAIEYLGVIGLSRIAAWEQTLLEYATRLLSNEAGVRILGTGPDKIGVVSFALEGVHPHDVGSILDGEGIAIRAGHHCAQPLMQRLDVPATARASFAFYNTLEEVERLVAGVRMVREIFG